MFRFSFIMAMCCGLLWTGALTAQDRRASGRERSAQVSPRQTGRTSGVVRRGGARLMQGGKARGAERGAAVSRSAVRRQDPLAQEVQQGRQRSPASGRTAQQGRANELFGTIQQGLASGSAAAFSGNLAPQVYLNLRGGESGYYSANQVHYVLENYFKSRRLVNVKFSTIGESDANPYATGSATFVERGSRSLAQVYVSLTRSGERWIITQINIY
jgi:hypothetical protein